MYKVNWKQEWPVLFLMALIAGLYLFFYDKLPDPIPVHWNIHGEVDNSMSKSILSALMPTLITIAIYVLMIVFPLIDPKKDRYIKFGHVYTILRISIVLFMMIMSFTVLMNMLGRQWPVQKIVPATVAVLFVVLGNYMGKIRSNWMVGIRLPWTLASEAVWNKTHRFGGKIMVVMGLAVLASLLFSSMTTFITLMISIAIMLVSTTVYSIMLYEKEKKVKNQ